ncbi:MAG: DUF3604 domain-containing protein [Gammaproteobacteria bacterium]|nr:DUF3604 domain-containing protein [Gammaproteobacteria bacterium]
MSILRNPVTAQFASSLLAGLITLQAAVAEETARTTGYNKLRNPYFGQTHLHSGWSFDEAIYNVTLGPDNAYRHARGEKVKHPAGFDVQLRIPLDFMIQSDHAEYLGVLVRMYNPDDPLSKHRLPRRLSDPEMTSPHPPRRFMVSFPRPSSPTAPPSRIRP